ncbi:MAG: ABC transporter permease [Anaerolineae bacterium]|nr:ABC transporter permease [Anaerolineae bacterium]
MKIWTIVWKDLYIALRNVFALVMMFLVPLMVTGLIYFAFGGFLKEQPELPTIRVQIVNLDQPGPATPHFGEILLQIFAQQKLSQFIQSTPVADEEKARRAVNSGRIDAAIVIPANFSNALVSSGEHASLLLYYDPTKTIAPRFLRNILQGFLDGFTGSQIVLQVAKQEATNRKLTLDEGALQELANSYSQWIMARGQEFREGKPPWLHTKVLSSEKQQQKGVDFIARTMAGMMIFFAFFTGASMAESILHEREQGTLARLFTTPTSHTTILAGKFIGVFITVLIQVLVLLLSSGLIFHITWGEPPHLALAILALVVASSGFGILLLSFITSTRQAGPVIGVVLTLSGVLGGLISTGVQVPKTLERLSRFVPQGWVMSSWKLCLERKPLSALFFPVIVSLLWGILTFATGAILFYKKLD